MLDEIDKAILQDRITARARINGPAVGDYILFPTGELERFSHDWVDGLQTSPGGSFYLFNTGSASFSGGLNPSTPRDAMQLTDTKLPGEFWFFHHDRAGAGRGVYFTIECRLFKTTANYDGFLGHDWVSPRITELKSLITNPTTIGA